MPQNKLKVKWNRSEEDFQIDFPKKSDGWLMYSHMKGELTWNELISELVKRGYDPKTLKFEVNLKGVPKCEIVA